MFKFLMIVLSLVAGILVSQACYADGGSNGYGSAGYNAAANSYGSAGYAIAVRKPVTRVRIVAPVVVQSGGSNGHARIPYRSGWRILRPVVVVN